MGAYYDSCHLCGEEISGRYDPERDDPDTDGPPLEVTERHAAHVEVCLVRRSVLLYGALTAWGEAIRRRNPGVQLRNGWGELVGYVTFPQNEDESAVRPPLK